jgi:hypothetical protein
MGHGLKSAKLNQIYSRLMGHGLKSAKLNRIEPRPMRHGPQKYNIQPVHSHALWDAPISIGSLCLLIHRILEKAY